MPNRDEVFAKPRRRKVVRKKSSAQPQGSPSMPSQRPVVRQRQERAATKAYTPPPSRTVKQGSPSRPAARPKARKVQERKATRKYVVAQKKAKQERQAIKRVEGVRKVLLADRLSREGYRGIGGTANAGRPKAEFKGQSMDLSAPLKVLGKGVKPAKAPALAALEQVSRPAYAIQGASYNATKAMKEGKGLSDVQADALKGLYRGATLKEKKLAGDNLRDNFGVKGKTAGVLGFGLDVATDPTTYLSFGAGSVAKSAAMKAASKTAKTREVARAAGKLPARQVRPTVKGAKAERQATKKALREGSRATPRKDVVKAASPTEARQVGAQARQRADEQFAASRTMRADTRAARKAGAKAAKKAPQGRGIQVGFGKWKTTGATSARALHVGKLPPSGQRVAATARNLGSEFSPWIKPAGVGQREFDVVRGTERQARATTQRGAYKAQQKGRALKKAVPKDQQARVIDAIERGTVYDLPENLRAPARDIELALKQARRAELKAGVKTPQSGKVKYFPHELKATFEGGKDAKHLDVVPKGAGGAKFLKRRGEQSTVKDIAKDGGNEFSTEIPAVVTNRLTESARKIGQARLGNALAQAGKPLKPGAKYDTRQEGVFLIRKGEAPKLLDGEDLTKAKAQAAQGADTGTDRYVIANKAFVSQRKERLTGPSERSQAGRAVDKVTGTWKTAATLTPGFYARNYIGDTFNSYLSQGAAGVARNTRHARAGLGQVGRQEKAAAKLGAKGRKTDRLIPVKDDLGRKSKKPLSKIVKEAESHGVIRTGYVGRELDDLLSGEVGGKVTKVKGKSSSTVQRARKSVEDMNRLSTYIGAQRKGMNPREAADEAMKHHFDYGDLSRVERKVMRRAMPFYTWSARNIPLQTKTLVGKPGKYATVEKARQEAAGAIGLPDDWDAEKLKEYQQRQAPFPIKAGGKTLLISSALPLTDLNQLSFLKKDPTAIDFGTEQFRKGVSLLNPFIKTWPELEANYNSFFRGPIESDTSPLVAAPGFVGAFPAGVKKQLGVVKFTDRKSGRRVWGWPGKVAYAASAALPGAGNFALQMANPVANQRGMGRGAKALSFVGGVKVEPEDPPGVAIERLFDEKTKLEKQRAKMRQQGEGSAESGLKETARYKKVKSRLKIVDHSITKQSTSRGDKDPLLSRGKVVKKKGSSTADDYQQFLKKSKVPSTADDYQKFLKGQ